MSSVPFYDNATYDSNNLSNNQHVKVKCVTLLSSCYLIKYKKRLGHHIMVEFLNGDEKVHNKFHHPQTTQKKKRKNVCSARSLL